MQEITLTQNTFKLFPTVYAVQNDTGRELKMIIQDQTLLLGDTGAVAVQRSDGSYYTIAATLNVLGNAFTADISQALTQPGRTLCQLKVTRSSLVVSSYTFAIMVQPSTDGISEEQLGYSVQQLRQDAEDIRAGGMPAALRLALLQIARKVAYIDGNGAQYYQDLYDALAPSAILTSISAVYTQSGTVYDTDTLDSLKSDLVVTANYSDGTSDTVLSSMYSLSGSLTVGTSTITVSYDGKTDDFSVTVTSYWTLDWDYTQGTPIGNGFSHSSAVVGSMVSDGYQIKGSSSTAGCNIILSENGDATKGVTEVVFKITADNSQFVGFHFDVANFWAFVANKESGKKTYYMNSPGGISSLNAVSFGTYALDTDYKIRLEWDASSGATLYVNDTLAYTISGALNGTDRTRWFLSASNNLTTAIIKSIKVRIEA